MSEETIVINLTEMTKLLRCHRSTVYRLLDAKKIPGAFKIGSDWRFHVESVIEWIKKGCPAT